MLVTRLLLYIANNQTNWDISAQPLTHAYICQVHRSTSETLYSLILSMHPLKPTTTASPSALPTNPTSVTKPTVLRKRLLIQLPTMNTKVASTLQRQQKWYKRYLDRKLRVQPVFQVVQPFHVYWPTLALLAADMKRSPRCKELRSRWTDPLKILEVRSHGIAIDDNGIPNAIAIDRARPVGNKRDRQNTRDVFNRYRFIPNWESHWATILSKTNLLLTKYSNTTGPRHTPISHPNVRLHP